MTQTSSVVVNSQFCIFGVQKLWILNRQSGICLFEQTFDARLREMDPDLIGGFLMAISKFCEEMIGEEIRVIETQSMRIYYQNAEKFVVAVLSQNTIKKSMAESFLKEVTDLFIGKYTSYLDAGHLANVSIFRDFAAEIENRYDTMTTCFIRYLAKRSMKQGLKPINMYDSLKGELKRQCMGLRRIPNKVRS